MELVSIRHRTVSDEKPGYVVDVTEITYYNENGKLNAMRSFGTHDEASMKMQLHGRRQRSKSVNQTVS